ncbi:hypothetical protein K469DRAFT_689637 [Zopfia rhizophila CBS 207.26]|uniref:VWFA domain-containing protein n=1 Tax=Zopfia rhizophila CBS 207.26 TaxID=1314779 RepID=A0A6A6E092_9PEZI|nr:hypothetical protein K469DRAFT_689637 [Zopfia rhizophila CBS 207.26]
MAFLGQVINHDEKGETDDGDDFVMLESSTCLPLHIKDEERKSNLDTVMPIPNSEKTEDALPQIDCEVLIHRVEDDGLIVKVVPPTEPFMNQSRGAVEIVLLIDVSGSMNDLAPVPPSSEGEESEQKGFTVLDLTKHAACTIAKSLNKHDTLCIVTFSTDCKVLLKCLPISTKNKKLAKEKILSMQPERATYLWSGMRLALDQFSGDRDMTAVLIVLTDGRQGGAYMEYSINLRTIQYGRPRDFFLLLGWHPDVRATASTNLRRLPHIRATLKYRQRQEEKRAFAESDLLIEGKTLSPAETAFYISRAMTVEFLSGLFLLTERGEHKPLLNDRVPTYDNLQHFLARLPANKFLDDPLNLGLIQDLIGADNKKGQVELALRTVVEPKKEKSSWEKWGCHYLSSLLIAHQFQKCFSFKDLGTQRYGKDSQLFRDQLDVLDNLFDSLPAPPPLRPPAPPSYETHVLCGTRKSPGGGSRRQYREDDPDRKAAHRRHREDTQRQHQGSADCAEVSHRLDKRQDHDGDSRQRHHQLDGGRTWFFPAEAYLEEKYPEMVKMGFIEPVYTVQLERQAGDVANDHAINVEGLWGATMGHGLTPKNAAGKVDVRVHDFYGDWDAVAKSLDKLPKHGGLALGNGTTKDEATGWSSGFLPFQGVGS